MSKRIPQPRVDFSLWFEHLNGEAIPAFAQTVQKTGKDGDKNSVCEAIEATKGILAGAREIVRQQRKALLN